MPSSLTITLVCLLSQQASGQLPKPGALPPARVPVGIVEAEAVSGKRKSRARQDGAVSVGTSNNTSMLQRAVTVTNMFVAPAPSAAGEAKFAMAGAPVQVDPVVENTPPQVPEAEDAVDFPEPIKFGEVGWQDALVNFKTAVKELNDRRVRSGFSPYQNAILQYSWEIVGSESASYKHCARFNSGGEVDHAIIDTLTTWDGHERVAGMSPIQAVLPIDMIHELHNSGWEPTSTNNDDLARFPCSHEHAGRIRTLQISKRKLGLIQGVDSIAFAPPHPNPAALMQELPQSYSVRTSHPTCAYPVQDQGGCGSCYAFASAAMAGERLCIANEMKPKVAGFMQSSRKLHRTRRSIPTPTWNLQSPIQHLAGARIYQHKGHHVELLHAGRVEQPEGDLTRQEEDEEDEERGEDDERDGSRANVEDDEYSDHHTTSAFFLTGAAAARGNSPPAACSYKVSRRRDKGGCACRRRMGKKWGCENNIQAPGEEAVVAAASDAPLTMPNVWLATVFAQWGGAKAAGIDQAAWSAACDAAGVQQGESDIMFLNFDVDSSGLVDIQERFLASLDCDIDGSLSAKDFAKWDYDSDGLLTSDDLKERNPDMITVFSMSTVEELLTLLDGDGSGDIDEKEWLAWMPTPAPGATGWKRAKPLSQQDIVSCGNSGAEGYKTPYCLMGPGKIKLMKYTQGCQGATLFNSAMFIHRFGIPSRKCAPYTSGGEAVHDGAFVDSEEAPSCSALEAKSCHGERLLNKVGLPVRLLKNDFANIFQAIYQGGPVMAGVDIYSHFMDRYKPPTMGMLYPDSIYKVNEETEHHIGGHAVVLHGWGKSSKGVQYYEGRNSWGTGWGMLGLFRIKVHDNKIITEVMYTSSDKDKVDGASECITIVQDGTTQTCTFKHNGNCPDSVRAFQYSYLGMEENCGRWTGYLPKLYPNTQHVQSNALFCQITKEQEVGKADSKMYYDDLTTKYPGQTCVLQNTYQGAGKRFICCGDSCASGPANTPMVFDEVFCTDEACMVSGMGKKRMEKME